MGFQSAQALHVQIEAKRLAYEDRARYYADPHFAKVPVEWLNSMDYAKERAKLIRLDRILEPVYPGHAPSHGDTTYFSMADKDGMMVSMIQSNFRGMGSGLVADGLGFMFQDRGELFSLQGWASQHLCARQATVPDDYSRVRGEGRCTVAGVRCDGWRYAAPGTDADYAQSRGLRPGCAGRRR